MTPNVHEQMLLRAIISQHTICGLTDTFRVACSAFSLGAAQRIEARSDETLQAARPEGQEPDPKGCAQ